MMMATVGTEWTLICVLATIWAWLRHGRYPTNYTGGRSRARRAPQRAPFDLMGSKAAVMRFLMIPGGILFGLYSVSAWSDVLSGAPQTSAPSVGAGIVAISGALLLGYLIMTGYEIYLLTSGLRMKRPTARRDDTPALRRFAPPRSPANSATPARPPTSAARLRPHETSDAAGKRAGTPTHERVGELAH